MKRVEIVECPECGGLRYVGPDGVEEAMYLAPPCTCDRSEDDADDPNVVAASIVNQLSERPDRT